MATEDQKADTAGRELNSQAIALAEQLGRMAGTLEGTAETWLSNSSSITDQLTKVRDGATQLLNSLAGGAATGRRAAQASTAPSSGSRTAGGAGVSSGSQGSTAARQSSRGTTASTRRASASASADPAHAPGKRHRKPSPSARGPKKTNASIPKMRTAAAVRRRRKSYA
jgi:hypothetical protein